MGLVEWDGSHSDFKTYLSSQLNLAWQFILTIKAEHLPRGWASALVDYNFLYHTIGGGKGCANGGPCMDYLKDEVMEDSNIGGEGSASSDFIFSIKKQKSIPVLT